MDVIKILLDFLIWIAVFVFGIYCGYGARPIIESGITLLKFKKAQNKAEELEEQKNSETAKLSNYTPASVNSLPQSLKVEEAAEEEIDVVGEKVNYPGVPDYNKK